MSGHAQAVLETAVASGATPGAVAVVLDRDLVLAELVVGQLALEPEPRPLTRDALYDLASLTKPIVATAALALLERGELSLDDPLARFLPAFDTPEKETIRLHHLLTHTAGLPAWFPLYTEARAPADALRVIARLPLNGEPGSRAEYSDLGFILLGAALEVAAAMPLDRLLRELVLQPLAMAETCFNPARDLLDRIAPTERDNAYEAAMVEQMGVSFDGWQLGLIHGRAHDGNAAYALEGVSGHAGLFAPAADVTRWAQMWLRMGDGLLHPRTVAAATRSWTEHLGERRGLGWSLYQPGPIGLPPHTARSGGDLLGPRAFGHTGFTGTSVWIDPDAGKAAILLSNRVHPTASPDRFSRVRALFHNAVVAGGGT